MTKHHVEKKDWFTLKNEAYGYFLTCRPDQKQPIVSYEVPGIHICNMLLAFIQGAHYELTIIF